jgi:hypothetical protein
MFCLSDPERNFNLSPTQTAKKIFDQALTIKRFLIYQIVAIKEEMLRLLKTIDRRAFRSCGRIDEMARESGSASRDCRLGSGRNWSGGICIIG